jgi:hypothetical protein
MSARSRYPALIVALLIGALSGADISAVPRTRTGAAAVAAAPATMPNTVMMPPLFVPNRGQYDSPAEFSSQGAGYRALFDRRGVSFDFNGVPLRLRFIGGGTGTDIRAELPQSAHVNYLRGADPSAWLRGLPTYGQITYRDVWPGIDLRFTGARGSFKYEFVVHPRARVDDIALAYDGSNGLTVDADGNLKIATIRGPLTDTKPIAFLDGTPEATVAAHFVTIGGGRYRFDVAPFDPSRTLVIDPGILFATYLGSTGAEGAFGVAADAAGNTYVVGYANAGFPTTDGAYGQSVSGDNDAFVAKLDPEGRRLLYSTFIGGSSYDAANYVAVDAAGYAYVAGTTTSRDFPTTAGAFQRTYTARAELALDTFVVKLDPSGASLVYSTYLGGGYSDVPGGLAIDADGNAYVAGQALSPDFPVTPGAYDTTAPNGYDKAFVTKLNPSGTALVYSTFLAAYSSASGIALNFSGRTFVSGSTFSPNFPTTTGAYQRTPSGDGDAFLVELNAQGSALLYVSASTSSIPSFSLEIRGAPISRPRRTPFSAGSAAPSREIPTGSSRASPRTGASSFRRISAAVVRTRSTRSLPGLAARTSSARRPLQVFRRRQVASGPR